MKLMGPPGPMASTHIYDFNVKGVDFEGRIYMDGMVCRKPPQQAIHWKSTSRLKTASLVAVVKIQDTGMQLKDSDHIIWAEVFLYLFLMISQDKLVSLYHGSPAERVLGVEPGILQFRFDIIIYYTTSPQLVDLMSPL